MEIAYINLWFEAKNILNPAAQLVLPLFSRRDTAGIWQQFT